MASRKAPFLATTLLCALSSAEAGPLLGLEWALSPENAALQSTLDVGEFDGLVRPNVAPYLGWKHNNHQILGGLGIALFTTSINETKTQLGNLRLSVDYRSTLPSKEDRPTAWAGIGGYQLIPLLKDENPDYSDSEKSVSEVQLSERRAQLSGTGFRIGVGVDFALTPVVSIGIQHHLVIHLNSLLEEDTLWTSFTTGETGFKAHIEF